MQEMIYQLWRSAERFDANYKFSTWMYRIALNVAISFYRKNSASGLRVELDAELVETSADPSAGSFGPPGGGSFGDDPLADVAGEIVRRIASSGQPVEYGQALFAIRAR